MGWGWGSRFAVFAGLLWILLPLPAGSMGDPGPTQLIDFDQDGELDDGDINFAIDRCGRGFREGAGGCHIIAPRGRICVYEGIRSGGETNQGAQFGLRFSGQAMVDAQMTGNNGASGGTLLQWCGPRGGTVWRHAGGGALELSNFTISLDPGNGGVFDNRRAARVGLEISANNPSSAPSQFPRLSRIAIEGSRDRIDRSSVGVRLVGATRNDQIDGLYAEQIAIFSVGIGLESDSYQAVVNQVYASKIWGATAAVLVRRGGLTLVDTLLSCRSRDCVYVDVSSEAAYVRLERLYAEVLDCKAFLRVGGGSTSSDAFRGNVVMTAGRLNLQCDSSEGSCSVPLVNASLRGTVVFRDNDIKAAGGPGPGRDRHFTVFADAPSGARGKILFDTNNWWSSIGQTLTGTLGDGIRLVVDGVDETTVHHTP